MKILPTITTIFDWREKIEEVKDLKLRELEARNYIINMLS